MPVDGERLAYQKLKNMQKKYAKMLYTSPIGTLSVIADEKYLYGIWVQEQKHFERGIGDKTIEELLVILF